MNAYRKTSNDLMGSLFVHHRKSLKLSQASFAKALGCKRSQLSMIEIGERMPTHDVVKKLETLTEKSLKELAIESLMR